MRIAVENGEGDIANLLIKHHPFLKHDNVNYNHIKTCNQKGIKPNFDKFLKVERVSYDSEIGRNLSRRKEQEAPDKPESKSNVFSSAGEETGAQTQLDSVT